MFLCYFILKGKWMCFNVERIGVVFIVFDSVEYFRVVFLDVFFKVVVC